MFHEARVSPAWAEFDGCPEACAKTAQENARERVQYTGPGLELLRRVYVEHLKSHMEAFYQHASAADVFALWAAFDLLERGWQGKATCNRDQATLIEAFLATLGLEPGILLKGKLQKRQPPVLTGIIVSKTKLIIEAGKESVTRKLKSHGSFEVHNIYFSNPQVQDKVDMLSLRARGEPKKAKPGAEDVSSRMTGDFTIGNGEITFNKLMYDLPGAQVNLTGVYSMDGEQFDFSGKVFAKATLRKMVASWWKSWLLTPISPLFKKDGAGTEIPIKISGTRSEPKFGLDLHFPGHSKSR